MRPGPMMLWMTTALASGACGDASTASADRDGTGDATTTDATTTDATTTDATTTDATTTDATTTAEVEASPCPLAANTRAASVSDSGCALLERDASACRPTREAAGLSGMWLMFSCRVSLAPMTVDGLEVVRATADGQPDYPSMYFPTTHACYEPWSDGDPNPNVIVARDRAIDIPRAPVVGTSNMGGGIVGIAVNGVPIFADFAAPGDDIFAEVATFDRCFAHPAPGGTYHYHGEPLAISSDDARLIGVLRDGYPVYGRRDADGSLPTLDAHGGHTSVTADSPDAPVYHYHLNEQVSTAAGTAGERQWFLTTGTYRGVPADCLDCR